MGKGTTLYNIVLLLHIVAAVIGFGGFVALGRQHAQAYRATAGEARVLLASARSGFNLPMYALYAVFVLGIVLVSVSDGDISFGAPWISASFVVWFLAVGALHGMLRPAVKALEERAAAMGAGASLEGDADADAAAKKIAGGELVAQLLMTVAIILMIWQPGN